MFETAELGRTLTKSDFSERARSLRTALLSIQRELATADFPVLIVIGGVDGAGKGEVQNRLFEWMDARGLSSYATDEPTQDERERPEYWRYWMALPPKGFVGVFLGAWYAPAVESHVSGDSSDDHLGAALRRAVAFEKNLTDDGALIIKLWLHISKKVQKKRLTKLEKNRDTAWRVTRRDWERHAAYADIRRTCERVIRETSTGDAPWTVIESEDARYRDVTVAEHVLERIRYRLENAPPVSQKTAASVDLPDPHTILDSLDLTQTIDAKAYGHELELLQGRMNRLARQVAKRQRGVLMVFEGWDAAGKGGAIRRITSALDARAYRVIPIAAPTDEERAHHYLWRFWRHLPRLGKFTIYDRSWYGRVLVERIEGFASERTWMRAYKEINDFEEHLVESGLIVMKFWLHISRDEQLRRFQERERESYKQYKIGPEDYRNRAKTNAYEGAANDMIERTSTEFAPWTLIEAEDKRYSRIKTLREACARLEAAL
ncbi:MAG: polyphosphate:AMP phosphotransferase [Myxococcales bacterium]|nr:polyphosphate:AMP phosphotransferase [Myxococcales bacterium]